MQILSSSVLFGAYNLFSRDTLRYARYTYRQVVRQESERS